MNTSVSDHNNRITKSSRQLCRLFLICLSMVLFSSCDKEREAIQKMCREIHKNYPQATLQDVYKTCYQDYFGAEHLIPDTAAARRYLHEELEECRGTDLSAMPKEEPTGFRHRFTRINLSNIAEGEMTEDQLLAAFLEAAGKGNAFSTDWESEWKKIADIATQVNPNWIDPDLLSELNEAARSNQPVRHSDAFRKAYKPHYRIVKSDGR